LGKAGVKPRYPQNGTGCNKLLRLIAVTFTQRGILITTLHLVSASLFLRLVIK